MSFLPLYGCVWRISFVREQKLSLTLICITPQKIYLQMTSNHKAEKYKAEPENSSCWWCWSSIIHVILKVGWYAGMSSSCPWAMNLPCFKFPNISFTHIQMLRHAKAFVLPIWEFCNVCLRCNSLRGAFCFCSARLCLFLFACHKWNRNYCR